jgi:hypothetical protein
MKTMRRIIIKVLLISILFFSVLNGKSQFFIDVSTGYALEANKEHIYIYNYSLGKGFSSRVGVGYAFNEFFGAKLNFSVHFGDVGGKTTFDIEGNRSYSAYSIADYIESPTIDKYEFFARMYRINPAIYFNKDFGKFELYGGAGFILGLGHITSIWDKVSEVNTEYREYKYYGDAAYGFNISLGLEYAVNNWASLYIELESINLSYTPTKGELLEFETTGYNYNYDELDIPQNFDLQDNIEYFGSTQSLKQSFPLSSIGANIGLKAYLFK